MEPASHYRAQAEHFRRLAERTWQVSLEDFLRILATNYDEVAEDLEVGAAEIRHADLVRD
jgi:hypothetical protein